METHVCVYEREENLQNENDIIDGSLRVIHSLQSQIFESAKAVIRRRRWVKLN